MEAHEELEERRQAELEFVTSACSPEEAWCDQGANNKEDHRIHMEQLHGALVHVDHMNDGKSYRKWLRKTSAATDVFIMIKQYFPNHDFSKRPTILVGIVGDQENVSDFLKRWRTSRVDVDSKGKACLERQMSVVMEGAMIEGVAMGSDIDWDKANAEDCLNVDKEQLDALLASVGGTQWIEAITGIVKG